MGVPILGGGSGVALEVDSSVHRAGRMSLRPGEGALFSGAYRKAQRSGTIAAGLAGASLVFGFRWAPTPSTALCLLRRIKVGFGNVTGFTAGFFDIDAFRATTYTALENSGGTAGTYSGNNGKLRTSHATSLGVTSYISTTAAISGGTETLDTDPFGTCSTSVSATAGNPPNAELDIFRPVPGEYPMVFVNNEGFLLKATAPATGTWNIAVTTEWDEILTGGF